MTCFNHSQACHNHCHVKKFKLSRTWWHIKSEPLAVIFKKERKGKSLVQWLNETEFKGGKKVTDWGGRADILKTRYFLALQGARPLDTSTCFHLHHVERERAGQKERELCGHSGLANAFTSVVILKKMSSSQLFCPHPTFFAENSSPIMQMPWRPGLTYHFV